MPHDSSSRPAQGAAADVVRIGCGLAGYEDHQIAPLFRDAPANVLLPFGWRELARVPGEETGTNG